MANSSQIKSHQSSPNDLDLEYLSSEDTITVAPDQPRIYPRSASDRSGKTAQGHRISKRGKRISGEESENIPRGINAEEIHDAADEAQEALDQLELTLANSLPSSDDINRKRNLAFPHAHIKRRKQTIRIPQSFPPILPPEMMATRPIALFVASLGNPPPYQSTRHSAGHIVLNYLRSNLSFPTFTLKSKTYASGHISSGSEVSRPEFTLWQSPSLMNVSGPALLKAWRQFVSMQKNGPIPPATGLVILHDEMEVEPGHIIVRRSGTGSAKGHNGIKSVQGSFNGAGEQAVLRDQVTRIGIGIGRPAGGSRDSRDVSAYVLGQLTSREKDNLEKAAQEVEGILYLELRRIGQV